MSDILNNIILILIIVDKTAHQKIGLMEKISPIKLYTKVKKSIEKKHKYPL